MTNPVADKLILKPEVEAFDRYAEVYSLTDREKAWFHDESAKSASFKKGQRLALQGRNDSSVHFLKTGWAYTAAEHGDGSRTVFDIHLPGDFIISPRALASPRKSSLVALTDCELTALNVDELTECVRQSSTSSKFMLQVLDHQHDLMCDRVVQTTRMPALTRVSYFHVSLLKRLREIAPSIDNRVVSPITQSLLSEILGMSEVHVSRTMMRLRALKVLVTTNRVIEYLDIEKLEQFSVIQDDFGAAA